MRGREGAQSRGIWTVTDCIVVLLAVPSWACQGNLALRISRVLRFSNHWLPGTVLTLIVPWLMSWVWIRAATADSWFTQPSDSQAGWRTALETWWVQQRPCSWMQQSSARSSQGILQLF